MEIPIYYCSEWVFFDGWMRVIAPARWPAFPKCIKEVKIWAILSPL
ncbi:MAG: hypothetical protein ACXABY_14050 [Candidatus Thorarchaeota archaeon]|jgi:hypothetical protein